MHYLQAARKKDWNCGPLTALAIPFANETSSTALGIFATRRLRSIPIPIHRSLLAWDQGIYPIVLDHQVPSPEAVLQQQAQGVRCATAVLGQDLLTWVENDRDPFSFLLHDLMHADHFFHHSEQVQAQIGFAQLMCKILNLAEIRKARATDPKFNHEFEYLIADMNTHGMHLLKYFKAILINHILRQAGLAEAARLPQELTPQITGFCLAVCDAWAFDECATTSFLNLNTEKESNSTHQVLYGKLFTQPTKNG